MHGFRGSKQWDYRSHSANRMYFADYNRDMALDDVRRRALTVLRSYCEGSGLSEGDLEGPLWALVDISHGSQAVRAACLWFKAAATCAEEEEVRRMLCLEAYGKIERALRCYL